MIPAPATGVVMAVLAANVRFFLVTPDNGRNTSAIGDDGRIKTDISSFGYRSGGAEKFNPTN